MKAIKFEDRAPALSFEQILEKVRIISKEVIAKNADKYDRTGSFPVENFAAIKAAGLLALLIPKQYGGAELSFYEYEQCIKEIAKGDASTASALNMHSIIMGGLADSIKSVEEERERKRIIPFAEKIFELVVHQHKVFAAATSEPKVGARFSQIRTTYERTDTGYVLNGKKAFVTMAPYADYYVVLANKKTQDNELASKENISYFIVSAQCQGISVSHLWDTVGMRATCSEEVTFNHVTLGKDAVFLGREGFALNKVLKEPQWVTGGYLGVYLGIMEAAFEFTINYLKTRTNYEEKKGLGFNEMIQARVSEMYTLLTNCENALTKAAQLVDQERGSENANRAIYMAKYLIGESAPQLTAMAIRTCGGASISKHFALERYYRDSICGGLMSAVSDACQLYLGRNLLNIETQSIW